MTITPSAGPTFIFTNSVNNAYFKEPSFCIVLTRSYVNLIFNCLYFFFPNVSGEELKLLRLVSLLSFSFSFFFFLIFARGF